MKPLSEFCCWHATRIACLELAKQSERDFDLVPGASSVLFGIPETLEISFHCLVVKRNLGKAVGINTFKRVDTTTLRLGFWHLNTAPPPAHEVDAGQTGRRW